MRKAFSTQVRSLHAQRYSLPVRPGALSAREEFPVINPATGDHLCTVECASTDDVRETIDFASKNKAWAATPAHARSKVLTRLARALEARIPDMARIETLQTGRTIREMSAQLGRLPEWLDYYAALLRTTEGFVAPTQGTLLNYVQRVPLGAVAQITPFNHPLLIAVKKIAPALAAGNNIIVKPSELAPISVLEFSKLADEAGLPPSTLSVLPGYGHTTGKAIVSHPSIRKVDITAGTETGRAIGSIVGANLAAYTAELGGKAPILVFADADIPSAVNGTAFAAFVASGQTCVSGTRVLVQSEVYDEFMERFLEKVEGVRKGMGDPMNPRSTMGTVISASHLARISGMVQRRPAHSTLLAGGARLTGTSALDAFPFARGSFFAPTVVAGVEPTDELWREEVFGPVVVVKAFEDEAEGVRLANDSRYALGAGVWTSDLSRAHRVAGAIEAGLVWVNTHHRNDPSSPWGGMKESGIGRENGVEALMAYSQSKSTIVNIASAEDTRVHDDWFAEDAGVKRYG
ncbi:hypothetical protein PLICRDRAFT_169620 [Plicaturopsis crispa FD-325 SS-3]|nr:hypothetical protein PLICRDRAFT_169620 [Plicaturopsis crispa FD-325 SS-3]